MAYTEFYCDPFNGSNLNGGNGASISTPGFQALPIYAGNGDSDGTSKFTPSDGSTPASTVNVGDFASIFNTAGATVTVFIGRVTAVAAGVNGAITVSTTVKAGTIPVNSGGGHGVSCRVGGAWQGPSAAVGFPLNFATGSLVNTSSNPTRISYLNTAIYAITAAISGAASGFITHQGCTASPGDGGKVVFDGGTTGASYSLYTIANTFGNIYRDLIFQNNGATGSASAVVVTNTNSTSLWIGCIVRNVRGIGFSAPGNIYAEMIECETYNCNTSNTSTGAGFVAGSNSNMLCFRCLSHDHSAGNKCHGFLFGECFDCISANNAGYGFNAVSVMEGCDAYNNTLSGYGTVNGGSSYARIVDCNFVKNGQYGIDFGLGSTVFGAVINCGFGSGTQANSSGATNIPVSQNVLVIGSISYASGVTPWVSPATGNFNISLAAAENTGRGNFTQTPYLSGALTAASNATPIVITSAAHGLSIGAIVTVASVGGNTAANGTFTVTAVTTNTFTLGGSVGNGAYTSGGTWNTAGTNSGWTAAITQGYPDVGAATHQASGGSGGATITGIESGGAL